MPGQRLSPELKDGEFENVLPDRGYRTSQRSMIDVHGANGGIMIIEGKLNTLGENFAPVSTPRISLEVTWD
jgi:hypothetical protein